MTTTPYSIDLRKRVIECIEAGESQAYASRRFKVSSSAVSNWWIRYQKEGVIDAKPRLGSKGKINEEELKLYVENNSEKTLIEIGKEFKVSACAIYKRLKKLGFSYKKKPSPMRKQRKRKEKAT